MKALAHTFSRPTWLELRPDGAWQPAIFLAIAMLMGVGLARGSLPTSIALLAGAMLMILILTRPLIGLGITLLLGPLGALENILWGSQLVDSGQAMLMVTLAAWVARGLVRRRLGITYTSLAVPLVLFIGAAALSVPNGVAMALGLKELLKWVEIVVVMLMVVAMGVNDNSSSWRAWKVTLSMLMLAGTSQALVGIWQFGLRGEGPETFGVLGRFYRAYGTFEQPNPFGGFMNLTALLAWGTFAGLIMYAWHRRREDEPPAEPAVARPGQSGILRSSTSALLLAGVCAVVTTAALLFSWSRGAWLGFSSGLVAAVVFWPRKPWQGPLTLLLGATFLGGLLLAGSSLHLLPDSLVARVSDLGQGMPIADVRGADINDANYAVLERLAHWQAALDMARDHPWLGIGFGGYEAAYPNYALINWPFALGHAHNYYLNMLSEGGVLGLAAYLVLWTCVIWQTVRLLGRTHWPERGIVLGLLASWTALSVHHLVDKLYVNNMYIHLGVMFGLLQLLDLRGRTRDKAV